MTGNLPRVIETLQEAIQTYPGQLSGYININVAYQTLGQYAKALPYAQKAVELQPEDAIAAENLLVAWLRWAGWMKCSGSWRGSISWGWTAARISRRSI